MKFKLTNDTKAVLLLCAYFGKGSSVKPLTQTEYSKLVRWLIDSVKRPSDLLNLNVAHAAAQNLGFSMSRIDTLMGRGLQLSLAVEDWQRNGVWVISRSDPEYPSRFKTHLKEKSPPLLFGCGDISLLAGGGIAIVGSRNLDKQGEVFTRTIASLCAKDQLMVVSGGARGVDQIAMTSALNSGGYTIGIVADNLLKQSVNKEYRQSIAQGRLLLISPFHPNVRFNVGNAMARNKLIYAMADYGLVVSSDYKKGGTWAGAIEELNRENGRPVFVRTDGSVPMGNTKMLNTGAMEWPMRSDLTLIETLNKLSAKRVIKRVEKVETLSLFDVTEDMSPKHLDEKIEIEESTAINHSDMLFHAVIEIISSILDKPLSLEDISKEFDVSKQQLSKWLKRAEDEKILVKLTKPVRYKRLHENQKK